MKSIETCTAEIFLYDTSIVWQKYKKGIEIGAEDIRKNTSASLKLTGGKRHSAILDTRDKDVSITNAALKLGASKAVTKDRFATAHLTTSLSGKLFGNLFMKFFKPKIKNKMFTDEKEAIAWLKTFS